jgi:hypothetical protein
MAYTRKTSCNGGRRVTGGKRASKKSYRKTQKRVRFLKQRKRKVKGG